MRKFKFGKLVRDKIVEAIKSAGNKPVYRKLSDDEYVVALKRKLAEEVAELVEEDGVVLEELADIEEIVESLLEVGGYERKDLERERERKNKKNGAFKKRLYVDHVEAKDNSPYVEFYLKNPHKYPEMKD